MPVSLPFQDISQNHPGVTKALATSYAEAASVCLDRHHVSPADMHIHYPNHATPIATAIDWACNSNLRDAWNNTDDATRDGAYAICLAAVELTHNMFAVRRAERHTGADYYVAPPNTPYDDMEKWIRVEISGTDIGDLSAIRGRLKEKIKQAQKGDSSLPAIAAVVGFKECIVVVSKVFES